MSMSNGRLPLPVVSVKTVAPVAKARAPRKPKPAPVQVATNAPVVAEPAPVQVPKRDLKVTRWAGFGVAFTSILSAGLNGYANAQHAPYAIAGWALGFAIPLLVLTLSKVAAEKWLKGQYTVAKIAGGSGAALLFLSVLHCAESISLITGSGLLLAVPLAIAIDLGLVACEIALATEPRS